MSETRYITVPHNITIAIESPVDGTIQPVIRKFEKFVIERTNDTEVFGKSLDGIMMGLSLRQAFKGSKPGDVIGVPLDQWEAVCKATRAPTAGYNPAVMIQLVEHALAIIDAPSQRPEAATEPVQAAAAE